MIILTQVVKMTEIFQINFEKYCHLDNLSTYH